MKNKIIFLNILLLLTAFTISGCKDKNMKPAGVAITAAKAVTQDVPIFYDEIGSCQPYEAVSVRSQVSGQITDVNFAQGADVKKGDMLFIIDIRRYQAALAGADASLAQSKAALELAKSEFARVKELLPTGAISKEVYDVKENAIIVCQAKIQADEAAVQTAKTNLEYCYIRSPIDGKTGQRYVDIGNVVIGNSLDAGAVMVKINRIDPIYVDFTVTQHELESVRQEMAKGNLKTLVRPENKPISEAREGTLSLLDNTVDQQTGTVKVRATLPNKDYYFWPGEFVQVRLILGIEKDAIVIPSEAVQNSQKGQYVYVVKADKSVEMRPVTFDRMLEGKTVIKGVMAGETVVTDGHLRLYPGALVEIKQMQDSEVATK